MPRDALRAKLAARKAAVASSSITAAVKSHPARPPPVIQPTKKDKREARHSALLSRVETSAAITKSSRKNTKRRDARALKQTLITGLESLADALPDANGEDEGENHVINESGKEALRSLQTSGGAGVPNGKMRMNTIRSKPGALKRKEKMLREECLRFGKNLAIIQTAKAAEKAPEKGQEEQKGSAAPQSNSWAALRGFIANTMEKKQEFVQKEHAAVIAAAGGGMEVDA